MLFYSLTKHRMEEVLKICFMLGKGRLAIVLVVYEKVLAGIKSNLSLPKKCPYSELFWSAFSRIRTEYGVIRSISPYSARKRENADQNNSEYGHFSRSV